MLRIIFNKLLNSLFESKSKKKAKEIMKEPSIVELQKRLDEDIEQYKDPKNDYLIKGKEYIKTFFNM